MLLKCQFLLYLLGLQCLHPLPGRVLPRLSNFLPQLQFPSRLSLMHQLNRLHSLRKWLLPQRRILQCLSRQLCSLCVSIELHNLFLFSLFVRSELSLLRRCPRRMLILH